MYHLVTRIKYQPEIGEFWTLEEHRVRFGKRSWFMLLFRIADRKLHTINSFQKEYYVSQASTTPHQKKIKIATPLNNGKMK